MRILKIDIRTVRMTLDEPYQIAYETVSGTSNVFIRVQSNEGVSGYGCAAPDESVTGETLETVLQALERTVIPALPGQDPLRPMRILERLRKDLAGHPSVMAALDMALIDLMARKSGLPVWRMLGGYRDRMKTSVTIGILSEKDTVFHALDWISKGFRCLKIKGGLDVNGDVKRVLGVREAVGPGIELRFDANQGYSVEETLFFVTETRSAGLELIEQPTSVREPRLLGRVTDRVPIPVMADEELKTLRDAFRIAKQGLADMVNVKLMKVGGLTEAGRITAVARSAGLEVMVGCMDEAALAIAAGLHFALARPNVAYADLDGHLGLSGDPSGTAVNLRGGVLFPSKQPGFGWEPEKGFFEA
jgi:L-alanine-DL-glutamate epimerase-like enolase superfamily enzyme